jgi:ABC-type glucose/galactose transport system permease subunit
MTVILIIATILILWGIKKFFYDNHSEPPETRIEDFEDTEIKFHDMEFSDTDYQVSEPSEQ